MGASDYIRKSIGSRIRECRKAQKISVEDLAEYCDVSPEHIRKIEGGHRAPGITVLVDICNKLKTSSSYFLQDVVTEVDGGSEIHWQMNGITDHKKQILERMVSLGIELTRNE